MDLAAAARRKPARGRATIAGAAPRGTDRRGRDPAPRRRRGRRRAARLHHGAVAPASAARRARLPARAHGDGDRRQPCLRSRRRGGPIPRRSSTSSRRPSTTACSTTASSASAPRWCRCAERRAPPRRGPRDHRRDPIQRRRHQRRGARRDPGADRPRIRAARLGPVRRRLHRVRRRARRDRRDLGRTRRTHRSAYRPPAAPQPARGSHHRLAARGPHRDDARARPCRRAGARTAHAAARAARRRGGRAPPRARAPAAIDPALRGACHDRGRTQRRPRRGAAGQGASPRLPSPRHPAPRVSLRGRAAAGGCPCPRAARRRRRAGRVPLRPADARARATGGRRSAHAGARRHDLHRVALRCRRGRRAQRGPRSGDVEVRQPGIPVRAHGYGRRLRTALPRCHIAGAQRQRGRRVPRRCAERDAPPRRRHALRQPPRRSGPAAPAPG